MDAARRLAFGIGVFLILGAVALQAGAAALLSRGAVPDLPRPGLGIASLALLDAPIAYALFLLLLDQVPRLRPALARLQWVANLLAALLLLILGVMAALAAWALLVLMIALLLAPPFGTLAYVAAWGRFGEAEARLLLGSAMTLKLAGLAMALVAFPALRRNRWLMLMAAIALLVAVILGLAHAWPPGVLVSLADTVVALVAAVLAACLALLLLFGALWTGLRAVLALRRGRA
jgi:hypothetical protein